MPERCPLDGRKIIVFNFMISPKIFMTFLFNAELFKLAPVKNNLPGINFHPLILGMYEYHG